MSCQFQFLLFFQCQILENKLADNQLFFEFDKIPKKKQDADFATALLPDNTAFNRYKDVLPYEDNRLRLTPTKNNKYGYINASHITVSNVHITNEFLFTNFLSPISKLYPNGSLIILQVSRETYFLGIFMGR